MQSSLSPDYAEVFNQNVGSLFVVTEWGKSMASTLMLESKEKIM